MIKLTFELFVEPELPTQWASRCVELGILSGGMTPTRALEAVASAVRMTVDYEVKLTGCTEPDAFTQLRMRAARAKEPAIGDCVRRVQARWYSATEVGTITSIQDGRLPWVVTWPNGCQTAYSTDEIVRCDAEGKPL
jgi:hypothetical protein